MNKLSKEAKDLYTKCYKALELDQRKKKLKEDILINLRRITLTVLHNLRVVSRRKYNNTLVQYYYLGLANKYLETQEEISSKEVRELSEQTRTEYLIERFIIDTFENSEYITYL